jgi:hypothetical protein
MDRKAEERQRQEREKIEERRECRLEHQWQNQLDMVHMLMMHMTGMQKLGDVNKEDHEDEEKNT